jgi:phospholipase/lecithinase/hemolysin
MTSRLSVAVLAAFLFAGPASALSFTNLYVFGDSLVDTGTTQDLVVNVFAGSDPAPASAGYFDGRFTNGPNPADVLNLAIEGTLAVGSRLGGDNYSYGGARARDNSAVAPPLTADPIPDLGAQVAEFSGDVGGIADPNALYMINVGGNDIFDALTLAANAIDPTSLIADAAAAIATSVLTLQSYGAQHILVVGVGDVGSPPSANGAEAIGRFFSENLNTAILGALPAGATFFDTIALFDAVNADPAAYGLPVGLLTETSCLGDLGPADPGAACDAYSFFDNTHPTSAVLTVLGDELVATVPEPGTGFLLGIGLVAMAARRRMAA